jgi:hypothetical protein
MRGDCTRHRRCLDELWAPANDSKNAQRLHVFSGQNWV